MPDACPRCAIAAKPDLTVCSSCGATIRSNATLAAITLVTLIGIFVLVIYVGSRMAMAI